jgi:hypothetical protein
MSPGNLTYVAQQAHGNAKLPVAFLPILKSKPFTTSGQFDGDLMYAYSLKKTSKKCIMHVLLMSLSLLKLG